MGHSSKKQLVHCCPPASIPLKTKGALSAIGQPLKSYVTGGGRGPGVRWVMSSLKDSLKPAGFISFSSLAQNKPNLDKERSWLHLLDDFPVTILFPVRKMFPFA